jgi:soluble lytic murein transglycosylase-like protein
MSGCVFRVARKIKKTIREPFAAKRERDYMTKLTVAAAAFAAGMMTFAVHALDKMMDNPKTLAEKATSKPAEIQKPATKDAPAAVDKLKTASVSVGSGPDLIDNARREMTGPAPKAAPYLFSGMVSRYAASYGVPTSLAHAVIQVESNYRVDAVGRAGEIGLMQIKPATARMMGYSGSEEGLYNPETNIKFGMKYLGMAQKLGGGTTCGTVLKYNAGHSAKRMNPVSAAYCVKVLRYLAGA